jgi:NitT/TauT family transport system substrate-binding protein
MMTRRSFLRSSVRAGAGIGIGIAALGAMPVSAGKSGAGKKQEARELRDLVWISPRGTLDVPDDYCLWVARDRGYFARLGLEVTLDPGPRETLATVRQVDQGRADVGYPLPGVLVAGIEQGMEVVMAHQMMPGQVLGFAVRSDGLVTEVGDIAGRSVAIGFAGWEMIVNPLLVEAGVDPESVEYVVTGMQMDRAVAEGRVDAALCWEGLRALWQAQGLGLRYLIGQRFSRMPSGGYAVRAADLNDPARRDLVVSFFRAASMGMHFYTVNSRAAAQIMYDSLPALRAQMPPELAYRCMNQVAWPHAEGYRGGRGYGWADLDGWEAYLDIAYRLGHTSRKLPLNRVVTNELVDEVNRFDHEEVEEDAAGFPLNDTWKALEPASGPFS